MSSEAWLKVTFGKDEGHPSSTFSGRRKSVVVGHQGWRKPKESDLITSLGSVEVMSFAE